MISFPQKRPQRSTLRDLNDSSNNKEKKEFVKLCSGALILNIKLYIKTNCSVVQTSAGRFEETDVSQQLIRVQLESGCGPGLKV